MTGKNNKLLKIILPAAFWLLIWEALAAVVNQPLLIPSPLQVILRLSELAVMPLFWKSALMSLLRIFTGFLAGALAGILLALATAYCRMADWILTPAIRLIRATPVASFIILLLLWLAKGKVPGVVSGIMVMPVIWESVSAGLGDADAGLMEMASAYALGRFKTFRYVIWPAVKPHLTAGISTSLGLAWKAGVAAEVLCLPHHAIGSQIYYAKLYLDTASLFAWTAVVLVLSGILEKLARHFFGGRFHEA